MVWHDEKYKLETYKKEEMSKFHKSRRMFAIKGGILHIAPEQADYSHAEWFEKMNWISKENDKLINQIIRGAVYKEEIAFYKGYNFEFLGIEQEFFNHLFELVNKLKLSRELKVIGGAHKQFGDEVPIKEFGTIQEIISDFKKTKKSPELFSKYFLSERK